MTLHVWPTEDAEAHIRELGAWWRANRPAARDVFKSALARVCDLLADSPNLGEPYEAGIAGLRRVRLRRTPYHVYYVPRLDHGDVVLIAGWSAQRGAGPALRMP